MTARVILFGLIHDSAFNVASSESYLMRIAQCVSPVLDWMLGEVALRDETTSNGEFRFQTILMGFLFYLSLACSLFAREIDDNVGSSWMSILISSTMPLFALCFGGVVRSRRRFMFSVLAMILMFNCLPRVSTAAIAKIGTTSGMFATFFIFFGVICSVLFHRMQRRYGQCRVEVMLASTVLFVLTSLPVLRNLLNQEVWTAFVGNFLVSWIYYRTLSRYTEQIDGDTFLLAIYQILKRAISMLVYYPFEVNNANNQPSALFCVFLAVLCYYASFAREMKSNEIKKDKQQ